ncbi:MAG TPA: hypothetical protein VGE52_15165 [Pirellulales bacterium]
MAVPSGFFALRGLAPDGVSEIDFAVARDYIVHLKRAGHEQRYYDAKLLDDALKHPAAIFQGLKRADFSDGLCYTCTPSRRWKSETLDLPFPKNFVFVVSVAPKDGHLLVLDWELRKADPTQVGRPLNWDADFERLLWPKR